MGFNSVGRRSAARIIPILILAALVLALPAAAGVVARAGLEGLARDAARVVRGRVLFLRPNPLGGVPCTDVTLEVEEAWKGEAAGTLTFSTLGGEVGGERVDVDGEAQFAPGEDVVVFLDENAWSGRSWVDGGEHGKVPILGGRVAATGTPLAGFRAYVKGAATGSPVPMMLSSAAVDSAGPHILAVAPNPVGSAGDQDLVLRIRGEHFGERPAQVTFPDWFGRAAGALVTWSDTLIEVRPPAPDTMLKVELTSGRVEVLDALGRSSLDLDGCETFACRPPSYLEVFYNAPRFRWSDSLETVPFRINPDRLPGGCGEDAVRAAFATWNTVPGSHFRFRDDGLTDARPNARDGVNTVGALSPWPFSHSWLAATIPWSRYDRDSAVILEVDTGLNFDDWSFQCTPGRVFSADLQTIALHEAGHWLRLRHVNNTTEIMQGVALVERSQHELAQGDMAGISHIYPSYGITQASRQGTVLCPAGDADSVVLDVTALDREGQPRRGVPAESVWVDLVAGLPGEDTRIHAAAPTDGSGQTRVVLHRALGEATVREVTTEVDGLRQARPSSFTVQSLDLSGDGRVGPEDLALAQGTWGMGAPGARPASLLPGVELIQQHLGHSLAGPGPRPPAVIAALRVGRNPSRGVVDLSYSVPSEGPVRVGIFAVSGQRVRSLWDAPASFGTHQLEWDGRTDTGGEAPAGVYLVRARIGSADLTRRIVRLH